MDVIHTHCDYHLGDSLIHLNFLRRVAQNHPEKRFIHAAHGVLLPQLAELVADVPNLSLRPLDLRENGSFDAWKARKGGFYNDPERNNWVLYHLQHFERLAADMGIENPVKSPRDLLFDYPALENGTIEPFDVLLINSMPFSGQLPGIKPEHFDELIGRLMDSGYSVVATAKSSYSLPCTQPHSVTAIGSMSMACKYIIGVATGPMWPTFNVWNFDTVQCRLILLEPERIHLTPNTEHAAGISQAIEILEARGIL